MKFKIILILFLAILTSKLLCQYKIPVIISTNFFYTQGVNDDWIHLEILDTIQNKIVYDSLATVYVNKGFHDTLYLDTGIYRCNVLDIGVNINMPIIKLKNGHTIPWGYPAYEYYLIELKNSFSEIQVSACDSFISPSNNYIWKATGVYHDTLENSIGADSIITIDLTINNPTYSNKTVESCGTYTSPSGKMWTTSGTYSDTISNYLGCDSIISINLTVNLPTSSILSDTICDSYISPSGKVLSTSGIYLDTIPNYYGCDSIMTINLTVNHHSLTYITDTVCNSFNSPNGKIWETTGIYLDTLENVTGCDSIISFNLFFNCTDLIYQSNVLSIKVFPNPTNKFVNIEMDEKVKQIILEIYQFDGKLISTNTYYNKDMIKINLPQNSGVYFLKLYNSEKQLNIFKVVKY